jgi:hypothetical protein
MRRRSGETQFEDGDSAIMMGDIRSGQMKNGSTRRKMKKSQPAVGQREPARSLEASIMDMARRGELAKPAQQARRRLRDKGVPITGRRGNQIITRHADGREEMLGEIESPIRTKLPEGVRIIEGS